MKIKKTTYLLVIFFVLSYLWSVQVKAATLEVGPSGYPYSAIQDAIDATDSGDTVLVHDGTYVENINFIGKAITVVSENGAGSTIVDGNASGSVVNFVSGESTSSVLEGFTIQNGLAHLGAGIHCAGTSPTIANCVISGNKTDSGGKGGGIYCISSSSVPTITNCTISENEARGTNGSGGGVYCGLYSHPYIDNCTITENTAAKAGGGIDCYASRADITNCLISGNIASTLGGGIHCYNMSPNIINCTITGNTVTGTTAGTGGGGISCYECSPVIINCTITENTGNSCGGAILCANASPVVVNSILWENSDLGGNPDEICLIGTSSIDITYSDIEGGYTGDGNIDDDPEFADAANGDFHLMSGSPCINSGTTSGAPEYDFEGDPRLSSVGGDDMPDMGADEVKAFVLEVGPSGYPYASIQAAIDDASDGYTILVHDGTYVENINFIGKAITVISENGAGNTIIDGNASGRVVTFESGEGADSALDGFTIQNGSGGIICSTGSSPTITNCIISGNSASNGGGIRCYLNSSPTISNCTISQNEASSILGQGGGIYCESSSPQITNCTITENTAKKDGGGLHCRASSYALLINCIITKNKADTGTAEGNGGGIHILGYSEPTITNSIIAGNEAENGAGISSESNSSPTIINCTITGNTADVDGGGIYCENVSSPTVINSILWDDTASGSPNEIVLISSSSINITYSDIEGSYTGIGNINDDPEFVGPDNDDFHLGPGSSCINTGTTTDAPEYDFEGDPRLGSVSGDNMPDMGVDEATAFVLEVGPSGYPYTSIRAAINDASDGHTILVHDGTYVENINFIGKAITVISENGAGNTIIDGNASGSGISFTLGEGVDSVLDGFTIRNGSETSGGGLRCYNSSPSIINCIIIENTADYLMGGGIYCYNSSPTITNCIIARNMSTNSNGRGGGGIGCYAGSSPTITNCTVYGNTAAIQGGGITSTGSHPTVLNSIFWGNSVNGDLDQIYLDGGSIDITYSDVQQTDGIYPGAGNINVHPTLVNPSSSNFHLRPDSPCIDAGNNIGIPDRDFEGDLRIIDGDDNGTETVDVGADEYMEKPDLIVESIITDPLYPDSEEPFTVNVTIKNQGMIDAVGQFQCSFNSGTKPFSFWQYWDQSDLSAGATVTIQFSVAGRDEDSYLMQAIVDCGDAINESNEMNNSSAVPVLVGSCPFEIILDTSNASKWFGGDDRPSSKPRNVGVGQSIMPQWDCEINSAGFKFSSRFDYYQNSSGQGHEVTLVFNIRASDGTIIDTTEKIVPEEFDGGWILFNLDADLEAGNNYIFTCYLKDGEIIEYTTGVLGHTEDLLPDSDGYHAKIDTIGGDMEEWSNWHSHLWDFNFRIAGNYKGVCTGDFDFDGDVDGTDLAILAAGFGTDYGESDLALFAEEFGRVNCR